VRSGHGALSWRTSRLAMAVGVGHNCNARPLRGIWSVEIAHTSSVRLSGQAQCKLPRPAPPDFGRKARTLGASPRVVPPAHARTTRRRCSADAARRPIAATAAGCTLVRARLAPPEAPPGTRWWTNQMRSSAAFEFPALCRTISRMRNNGGTRGPSSDKVCCSGIEQQASGH
jgi:hypothetical protein